MPQLASPLKERRRALRLLVVNWGRSLLSFIICQDLWHLAGSRILNFHPSWLEGYSTFSSPYCSPVMCCPKPKAGKAGVCCLSQFLPCSPPKPKRQRMDGIGTRHFIGCRRSGFLQRKADQGRKEREGGRVDLQAKALKPAFLRMRVGDSLYI